MAENKTQKTNADVAGFLEQVEPEQKREDAFEILEMMEKSTGEKPKMWGPSIVGFGDVHLKYDSGREVDYFKIGFSPRKASLTLYIMQTFPSRDGHLGRLGKHTTGKGCLYIKKLDDIDREVLKQLIDDAVAAANSN